MLQLQNITENLQSTKHFFHFLPPQEMEEIGETLAKTAANIKCFKLCLQSGH